LCVIFTGLFRIVLWLEAPLMSSSTTTPFLWESRQNALPPSPSSPPAVCEASSSTAMPVAAAFSERRDHSPRKSIHPHHKVGLGDRKVDVSGLLAEKMLQGWTLLERSCPRCNVPLMKESRHVKEMLCVQCGCRVMHEQDVDASSHDLKTREETVSIKSTISDPSQSHFHHSSNRSSEKEETTTAALKDTTDVHNGSSAIPCRDPRSHHTDIKTNIDLLSSPAAIQSSATQALYLQMYHLTCQMQNATNVDHVLQLANALQGVAQALASVQRLQQNK